MLESGLYCSHLQEENPQKLLKCTKNLQKMNSISKSKPVTLLLLSADKMLIVNGSTIGQFAAGQFLM